MLPLTKFSQVLRISAVLAALNLVANVAGQYASGSLNCCNDQIATSRCYWQNEITCPPPNDECKSGLTTHTLCNVWEDLEHCASWRACERFTSDVGIVSCQPALDHPTCRLEYVYEAVMEPDCLNCYE